jgi:hypothetical protein
VSSALTQTHPAAEHEFKDAYSLERWADRFFGARTLADLLA